MRNSSGVWGEVCAANAVISAAIPTSAALAVAQLSLLVQLNKGTWSLVPGISRLLSGLQEKEMHLRSVPEEVNE
jgi:hypothetical protein